jgi:phospholipid/cholesterol/gamma-HCH transport system substrate-binding protein/paraquat-inducible protein B
VITSVSTAVAAVIILGAGELFREETLVETYFLESVQGLSVGSVVTFRGVPIGKVEEITLTGNVYPTTTRYALVRSAILSDAFKVENRGWNKEIEMGLRFRLAAQGLTGAYYLEADYLEPSEYKPLDIEWKPRYPYVPSVPSTYTRLTDALKSLTASLQEIDYHKIASELGASLSTLSKLLEQIDMKKIGGDAEELLEELRATNKSVGELFAERLPESLEQLEVTFRRLNDLVARQQREIEATIGNFRRASENLRELSENVMRQPSQLFFSEPPPPSGGRR